MWYKARQYCKCCMYNKTYYVLCENWLSLRVPCKIGWPLWNGDQAGCPFNIYTFIQIQLNASIISCWQLKSIILRNIVVFNCFNRLFHQELPLTMQDCDMYETGINDMCALILVAVTEKAVHPTMVDPSKEQKISLPRGHPDKMYIQVKPNTFHTKTEVSVGVRETTLEQMTVVVWLINIVKYACCFVYLHFPQAEACKNMKNAGKLERSSIYSLNIGNRPMEVIKAKIPFGKSKQGIIH